MLKTSTNNQVSDIYNRAQELLNQQKYNPLLAIIKKAYKRLQLTESQRISFVVLELTALVKTEKLIRAEILIKEHWPQLSKSQRIDAANMIGTVYATSVIYSNPEKAFYYLKKSYKLDESISNADAIVMLIQLHMLVYDYTESEQLWTKISKWPNYFDFVIIQRLTSAYMLNFKKLALDSVQFMLRNKNLISKGNYESLVHYLIYLKLKEDAVNVLGGGQEKFSSSDSKAYLTALVEFENNKILQCINTIKNIKSHFSSSYNLLAKCEEKLGNFVEAFDYFDRSASKVHEENEGKSFSNFLIHYKKMSFEKLLVNLDKKIKPTINKNMAMVDIDGKAIELCFMLGFPRSGTTLLDNILDSQNNISVLSEIGGLERLIAKYDRLTGKSYPCGLEFLSTEDIQHLKKEYVSLLNNYFRSQLLLENNDNDMNKCIDLIVDKMPLSSIHLPFIRCLFPDVKVICSIRHPLDVVLSNFQQSYKMNNEMSFLVSLEDCVTRYIEVFDHIDKCEESLGLNFHYVKYEKLVSNFEEETISTFDYLNVVPNENYKKFYEHASNKIVATSSRSQVLNGIYKTSTYKWKNYREQLEPYIKRLMPYIKKFGYDSTM